MNKEKNNIFIVMLIVMIILLAFVFIYLPSQKLSNDETTILSAENAIIKTILPNIKTKNTMIHSKAIAAGVKNGLVEIDNRSIELVNGYPSVQSIINLTPLAKDAFMIDKQNAKTVLIKNGDCLISYTEATNGQPPVIIDMFNNCL